MYTPQKLAQNIQRCVYVIQSPRLHVRKTGVFCFTQYDIFSRGRSLACSDDSGLGDNIAGKYNTLFFVLDKLWQILSEGRIKPPAATTTPPQTRPSFLFMWLGPKEGSPGSTERVPRCAPTLVLHVGAHFPEFIL